MTDTSATPASAADAILATLQDAYDRVKVDAPHRLRRDDDITEDLDLDSMEFIDVVSLLEGELPPDQVDAVIDRLPELRTVGDLVDAFVAGS
jgi:acyl carrier protein